MQNFYKYRTTSQQSHKLFQQHNKNYQQNADHIENKAAGRVVAQGRASHVSSSRIDICAIHLALVAHNCSHRSIGKNSCSGCTITELLQTYDVPMLTIGPDGSRHGDFECDLDLKTQGKAQENVVGHRLFTLETKTNSEFYGDLILKDIVLS